MSEIKTPYTTSWPYPRQDWAVSVSPSLLGSNGHGEQAVGTIFTDYIRTGGVDVEKLSQSVINFILIQIGRGKSINVLLDEQIENCLEADKDFGFFHLPSAYAGTAKSQAQWAVDTIAKRGYINRLIEGDLEDAIRGDPNSCLTANQGWIYHQELEFCAGREQVEYSNPDVLHNRWHEPSWIWNVKWMIARYPRLYYYFRDFLADYPWKQVYGYLPDEFYDQCVIGTQFAEVLDAQYYFASKYTNDPKFKVGIKGATGEALLMTPDEATIWINGGDIPEPPPIDPPESEILYTARVVNCSQLRIRGGSDYPAWDAPHEGWLFRDAPVDVLEEVTTDNGSICCRFNGELWAWRYYNGVTYLEIV